MSFATSSPINSHLDNIEIGKVIQAVDVLFISFLTWGPRFHCFHRCLQAWQKALKSRRVSHRRPKSNLTGDLQSFNCCQQWINMGDGGWY